MTKIPTLFTLLAALAPALSAGGDDFPRERQEGSSLNARKDWFEGRLPPGLDGKDWINRPRGVEIQLSDLRGRVVLVVMFGTWSKASREIVPGLEGLYTKYRDQGLEVVAVHTQNGADRLPAFVVEHALSFPVATDVRGVTARNYVVDSYPDFWLIDRSGKVRVADLADAAVEDAVKALLAEPLPLSAQRYPVRLQRSWPRAGYGLFEGEKRVGGWSLENRHVQDEAGERMVLVDRFELDGRAGTMTSECGVGPGLGLRSVRGPAELALDFADGAMKGTFQRDLARPVQTDATFLRGSFVNFRPGVDVTLDHLDTTTGEVEPWTLTCEAEEPLRLGERRLPAWRFRLVRPSGTSTVWFGRERQLLRWRDGKREWRLEELPAPAPR